MSTDLIVALAVCVVVVFWTVGARGRLGVLRDEMARTLGPLKSQVTHRQALLLQWADASSAVIGATAQCAAPLRAACEQFDAAFGSLCAAPASDEAASNLRLAESVLATARQRLLSEAPARQPHLSRLEIEELARQLAATDNTLAFASGQFNEASLAYSRAVRQFPTCLIARSLGFRPAGLL
jgi:hypothetical protein